MPLKSHLAGIDEVGFFLRLGLRISTARLGRGCRPRLLLVDHLR